MPSKPIGVDGRDIRIIANLCWHQKAAMRIQNKLSLFTSIQRRRRVRQGCELSLYLLNIYTEFIFRECEHLPGINIHGINEKGFRIPLYFIVTFMSSVRWRALSKAYSFFFSVGVLCLITARWEGRPIADLIFSRTRHFQTHFWWIQATMLLYLCECYWLCQKFTRQTIDAWKGFKLEQRSWISLYSTNYTLRNIFLQKSSK